MTEITDAQLRAALWAWGNTKGIVEGMRAALLAAEKARPVGQPFFFERYVGGVRMADDVLIEREHTLDDAIRKAVAICAAREKTVLVHRSAKARPVDASIAKIEELAKVAGQQRGRAERAEAERDAARAKAEALAGALHEAFSVLCDKGCPVALYDKIVGIIPTKSERACPPAFGVTTASGGADARPASAPTRFICDNGHVFTRTGPDDGRPPACPQCGRLGAVHFEKGWLSRDQQDDLRVRGIWKPIATAPKDREIAVYCPSRDGLPHFVSRCQWHEDAGFCVDELREPELWTELPVVKQSLTTDGPARGER